MLTKFLIRVGPEFQRFFRGGVWSVFGGTGARLISLLLTLLLVRSIDTQGFARYAVVQATVLLALAFAGYGPALAATRFAARLRSADVIRLGKVLGLLRAATVIGSLLTAMLIVFCSNFLALSVLGNGSVAALLVIGAFAVIFGGLDSFQSGVLVGFEAMRESAISMLAGALLGAPVTLLLATAFGVSGAVVGIVLTYAIQWAASWWFLRRLCAKHSVEISIRGARAELAATLQFATPSALSGLMVAPAHWAVQAGLSRSSENGVDLAVFAIAMQWFHAITLVPQLVGRAILPVLTDAGSRGDHRGAMRLLTLTVAAYALTVLPLAVCIALLSESIMRLYLPELASHSRTLGITALAAAAASLCAPVGQAIAAEGRMWLGFAANLMWATVFVALSAYWLADGALGAGAALLVAYSCLFCAVLVIVWLSFSRFR